MIRKAAFALGLCGVVATSVSAQRLPLAGPEEVGLSSERLQRIGEVFQGYVDEGRIAGAVGMVLRHGKLAYVDAWGMRDMAAGDTMEEDDLFKICSMTKPVTSVAVMTLYEEGHFFLSDPIGRYLPELANLQVANLAEASAGQDIPTERARRPVTIHDLLRHTSGFTYGDLSNTVVDAVYRERNILGEFKRSSQHLRKEEELRWRQASADGRIELCVRRWVHPVVPRWGAGSIGRGFGKKLLEGCRARSRRWQPACLPLLGRAGFANVVACHLSVFVLCRGATYRSSSEKRLRFFKPAVVAYVRSPGSCAAHRRRSRENCGGTQQREVETSSIEPRPPNGMPIGGRSVRKLPNSLRTAN